MKYVIIGGSRGLGLSIANILLRKNNEIVVFDINPLEIPNEKIIYKRFDLTKDDFLLLKNDIENSDGVIFTAGIGRVAFFNDYNFDEIERTISIDLISLIKIITISSDRIMTKNDFYFMCISSIAGLVSSPLFSVYSAAKAGVCKYVEAVNTELLKSKCNNRITNVVATSFDGTAFNGGKTNLLCLESLSEYLIESMLRKDEICKVNNELIDSIIRNTMN